MYAEKQHNEIKIFKISQTIRRNAKGAFPLRLRVALRGERDADSVYFSRHATQRAAAMEIRLSCLEMAIKQNRLKSRLLRQTQ